MHQPRPPARAAAGWLEPAAVERTVWAVCPPPYFLAACHQRHPPSCRPRCPQARAVAAAARCSSSLRVSAAWLSAARRVPARCPFTHPADHLPPTTTYARTPHTHPTHHHHTLTPTHPRRLHRAARQHQVARRLGPAVPVLHRLLRGLLPALPGRRRLQGPVLLQEHARALGLLVLPVQAGRVSRVGAVQGGGSTRGWVPGVGRGWAGGTAGARRRAWLGTGRHAAAPAPQHGGERRGRRRRSRAGAGPELGWSWA